ncbi:hypothetical protein [Gemmata sp.]|uniref:hypothetical protein n=1 Tax=Gemmata sp. TaxID=1914242 RepID=UPI003F6E6435
MEPVVVYHFVLCRRASYDLGDPVAPYSLHNVVFQLGPEAGETYPLAGIDLWVSARLEGEDGHEFWIDVVRITGDDEFSEELITAYGPLIAPFGSDRRTMSRAWHLRRVPFDVPGLYEFRLMQGDEILAVASIRLED